MLNLISIILTLFAVVQAFDYVEFKRKYCYEDTNVRTTGYYFPYFVDNTIWPTGFVCENFVLTKDDIDYMARNNFIISSNLYVVLKNCEIDYFNEYLVSKFNNIKRLYFENCKLSWKNPEVIGNTAISTQFHVLGFHKCNILGNLKSSALQKFTQLMVFLIQNSTFEYSQIDEYFLPKKNNLFVFAADNVNVKRFSKGFLSTFPHDLSYLSCTLCQLDEIDSLFHQMKHKASSLVSFDNNSIKNLPSSLDILANFDTTAELHLSGNDIQEELLKRIHLKSLNELIMLDLSRNSNITGIDYLAFADTRYLKNLNMSNVNLKYLNKLGNVNLTTIDFSQNIISSVHQDVFEGLANLIFLDLSYNKIEVFEGAVFQGLRNLKELRLNSNQIDVFQKDLFGGLSNLQILDLSDNILSRIHGLNNLSNLKELRFRNNFLKIIPSSKFLPSSLRILDISHNALTFIGKNTFSNVRQLTTLDISYTNNTYIEFDKESFRQLTSLKTLKSAGNTIHSIEDILLPANLQELDLEHNKITVITSKDLEGLVNLENLNLANNHIYVIEKGVLSKLSEIEYVDLSGNDL